MLQRGVTFTGSGAFWRHPRRPLAGVALAAAGGILLAEGLRRQFPAFAAEPGVAVAAALVLAAVFCVRPGPAAFWPLVMAGFGTLHALYCAPVPATLLAARVAQSADSHSGRCDLRVEGTVLDVPRRTADDAPWRFTLALDSTEIDGVRWPSHAPVSILWRGGPPALAAGSRLRVLGTAANLKPPRNPGEFDLAGWRARHGIFTEIRAQGTADVAILSTPGSALDRARAGLAAAAARCHDAVAACLARDLDDAPEVRAVVGTMLLGLHGEPGLGDELEGLFQRTGTLHYFAVDGLKLGLFAVLCLRLLEFTGLSRAAVGRLTLPLLGVYALAAGLGPASLRALSVAAVLVGGVWLDRPARPGNGLGAAAALLLLWDTRSLFEAGFQLTFLVVLSILALTPPLSAWLERFGAPDPFLPRELYGRVRSAWEGLRRGTADLLAVALAAWVGSLPVMVWTFGWVSPVSVVANVLTFPLAFAVLSLGVLSLAGGWLVPAWSVWMNNANWLAARAFLAVVRACDAVPHGSIHVGDPGSWHWTPPVAEVTLLDTSGQGYAAHLRVRGGGDWLLDTARPTGYGRVVRPCLLSRAVERLDGGLILSQGDVLHLAAAPLVLGDFHPARVVEPAPPSARSPYVRELRQALAARGGPPETFLHRGDVLALGPDARMVVLSPPVDLAGKGATAADRALVLRLDAAGWRVLFLPNGAEDVPPEDLRCDVLVSPNPSTRQQGNSPTWVLLQDGAASPDAPPQTSGTLSQRRVGAIILSIYPDHLEARGFLRERLLLHRETGSREAAGREHW